MGHNMASWRLLEQMLITLEKKGSTIPANVMSDLRAAKSMIKLSCVEGRGSGDAMAKAEELTSGVEAYLVNEAQKTLCAEEIDEWLKRLEEANAETYDTAPKEEKFVTGVPREQKWVRVEPMDNLPTRQIEQLAKAQNLQVTEQKDCKLLVFGQQEDIKQFLKKMTEAAKQASAK